MSTYYESVVLYVAIAWGFELVFHLTPPMLLSISLINYPLLYYSTPADEKIKLQKICVSKNVNLRCKLRKIRLCIEILINMKLPFSGTPHNFVCRWSFYTYEIFSRYKTFVTWLVLCNFIFKYLIISFGYFFTYKWISHIPSLYRTWPMKIHLIDTVSF